MLQTITTVTKSDLLARAKVLEIVGRHEMSKSDLAMAIAEAEAELGDDETETETDEDAVEAAEAAAQLAASLDPEVTKDKKRRYPSEAKRDPITRKVVRKGTKFNLNVPYREKLYYLPTSLAGLAEFQAVLAAAPPQVRAIANTMLQDFCTSDEAARGVTVVERAKATGRLTSKIDSAMLFAYYRKVLESCGVVHYEGGDDE